MTPLHIELLLACYVSPDPEVYLGLERWRSSAAVTFLADLQAWGCIDGGTFRVTARAGDPVGRHAYAQFGIAAVVIGAVSWPGFSELVAVSPRKVVIRQADRLRSLIPIVRVLHGYRFGSLRG